MSHTMPNPPSQTVYAEFLGAGSNTLELRVAESRKLSEFLLNTEGCGRFAVLPCSEEEVVVKMSREDAKMLGNNPWNCSGELFARLAAACRAATEEGT